MRSCVKEQFFVERVFGDFISVWQVFFGVFLVFFWTPGIAKVRRIMAIGQILGKICFFHQ